MSAPRWGHLLSRSVHRIGSRPFRLHSEMTEQTEADASTLREDGEEAHHR